MQQYQMLTLCVLMPATILAGGAAATPDLQTLQDNASDDNAIEVIKVYADSYRSTGTKSRLTPLQAPMSYQIYDAALLQLRQVDSVNEALRYAPGITTENRSTVTIFDQYTIRGFDSYRNYYDGLPLQYNGLWNLAPQVDAYATESVEVLKGPTSVLYGSAPPGGMVNQTAKQPQAQTQHQARARLGSGQLAEVAFDSTGAVTGQANYRLIGLARQKDGQQQSTREQRYVIAPSLSWAFNEATSVNLNLYYQNDPEMVPSTPLPAMGTLYPASYGYLPADAYAGDKNWAGFKRELTMLGYKLHHQVSPGLSLLQNLRYTRADGKQQNSYNLGLSDGDAMLARTAYFTDEAIDGYVVDNQLAWATNGNAWRNQLLLGVEYNSLDSQVRYGDTLGVNTPALNLAQPDYNLMDPAQLPLDTYSQQNQIEQRQLGVYLQNEWQLSGLLLLAGLRHDRYDSRDDANFAGVLSTTDIDQRHTSVRLAAMYTFDSGWAPYISYSESFEPVSGTDSVTGEAFKPTTADQIELGVKYNGDTTQLTLAAFDLRKQQVVVNTPDFMQKTQTGEVQSKGVEMTLQQQVTADVSLNLSLTQLDVAVSRNPLNPALVAKTPVWVAEQQAAAWAHYYVSDKLELSTGVRYVGPSQLDELNSDQLPGYTLWDLALAYQLSDNYKLGLTASNLGNKRYVGACYDQNNCWMGAERSVELNLYAGF
ncbi:TonB-dependent siderophore receptor [Rheinheimera nanhaiensis]|uniref:Iron complex outermembrane recepter protein n=1 Tax=Rheinheimera nanhaiensis E407-8 TaxID=562729 RepID=I1E2Q8_9GAMM|nr:TonB-dependent siderophore receptor [Rheinheimera nanhaiensis]GAB60586.1 iron complex outermembrane recepter protein [Rheinheimera nanhaiensis E407-8]